MNADETKTCPLCGGRVFWFPISNYWGCEHCKNTFNRYTVFPDEVKKTDGSHTNAGKRGEISNEKQESMADIVADIRERAENAMRNGERLVHNEAVANMLTFVADRLDAARKRERGRLASEPRSWEECVARAIKAKENSDELY